jgi:hypothetical protein
MLDTDGGNGAQKKFSVAPSAVNTEASDEKDDSIIYKSSNTLLPKTNECGREKIENRIYSGQVSAVALVVGMTNCLFFRNFLCESLV